jgi:hypothetical protein
MFPLTVVPLTVANDASASDARDHEMRVVTASACETPRSISGSAPRVGIVPDVAGRHALRCDWQRQQYRQ